MISRASILFGLLMVGSVPVLEAQLSVVDTKHNLSVSGPGSIRAESETRVCVFCHTPHTAMGMGPLWNKEDPGTVYRTYYSPTLQAFGGTESRGSINGASKLCLSCHDGTIALGSTLSAGAIRMQGGVRGLPAESKDHLGFDLSGDHPVSFPVTEALIGENNSRGDVPLKSLHQMRNSGSARLDANDMVQCTSCHDAHSNPSGNFLLSPSVGEICLSCHDL